MRDLIQLPRRSEVASEGLLDDDARMVGQFRRAQSFDYCFEERRRDGKIVRWPTRVTKLVFQRSESVRVRVIAAHIPEQRQKMFEGAPIIDAARALYTVRHALVQAFRTPLRKGNADYRDLQRASFHHRIESREDHLVGEIACDTEDHQCVRMGSGHQASAFVAAFSSWPPN